MMKSMFPQVLLVVTLVLAAVSAFPANNVADLVISAMRAKLNSTPNRIADFEIISPKPQTWDKADVSQGKITSVSRLMRTGDARISLATGKLILTIPFRLETVTASFNVQIIEYFSKWFKYSQTVTANCTGLGALQIQVTTVGGQCKGDIYGVDIKLDDHTTAEAGTPQPNDVADFKEIDDFVTSELTKRYQSSIPAVVKPFIEAVTRSVLLDLKLC